MDVYTGKTTKEPIDIIVPTHNRLDLTIKCIDALYKNTTTPFHLIIVDDSTDLTPSYVRQFINSNGHSNITYLHSKKPYKTGNQFFNAALKKCKNDIVATVSNSTTVEPEWDIVALEVMRKDPKVGIVGLKSLFPHGRIESAGITLVGYKPVDIGLDFPGHQLTSVYECPAVQWSFVIFRKEAVVGNLDENLYHGFKGYEDIDTCFILRKNGWKVLYCGLGAGYHEPKATRGSNDMDSHIKNLENAEVFYKRWGLEEAFKKSGSKTVAQVKAYIKDEDAKREAK